MIPAPWSLALLLARTDDVAISVLGAHIYPTGLTLRFVLVFRKRPDDYRFGHVFMPSLRRSGIDPDEVLRLGIRYSDGRSWSNLGQPEGLELLEADFEETAPGLFLLGGHGHHKTYEQGMYLAPLPPDGTLEFICAWPKYGIAETVAATDVTGIAVAAAKAIQLWPDDEAEPDHDRPKPLRLGEKGNSFFPPILGQDAQSE